MKKLFTLTAILFTSLSLFAFFPKSMLSISSNSNMPVTILVDNRDCDAPNSNEVMLKSIDAGYHTIKVYRDRSTWYGRNNRPIYSGNVYVKPGFHVDITINRFGKAFIDERQLNFNNHGDDDYDNDEDWGNWNHSRAMGTNDFNQFKQTITNAGFENTKLAIAKQTIGNNYFTAAQVKEIVGLFSFENSKLDIAKTAYRRSIDKNNYFIVSDAFAFNSSKEELAKFLETSR
jgi:Domain of unknown function (DUF4476)